MKVRQTPSTGTSSTDLAVRLDHFFVKLDGHAGHLRRASLAKRLTLLFDAVRSLTEVEATATPTLRLPDLEPLRELLVKLAPQLETARLTGNLTDVWSIARIGRNEVRNSAVLAGLWNTLLCGRAATNFLAAFLDRIEADENLPTAAELQAGYTIRTEARPLDRGDERVDIVIEGADFLLGIELKIDAPEGPDQLSAYRNALQQRASTDLKRPALIYLSPRPPLDGFTCHARWSDVAAAARRAVPRREADRTFVHQLIAQFATHILKF